MNQQRLLLEAVPQEEQEMYLRRHRAKQATSSQTDMHGYIMVNFRIFETNKSKKIKIYLSILYLFSTTYDGIKEWMLFVMFMTKFCFKQTKYDSLVESWMQHCWPH